MPRNTGQEVHMIRAITPTVSKNQYSLISVPILLHTGYLETIIQKNSDFRIQKGCFQEILFPMPLESLAGIPKHDFQRKTVSQDPILRAQVTETPFLLFGQPSPVGFFDNRSITKEQRPFLSKQPLCSCNRSTNRPYIFSGPFSWLFSCCTCRRVWNVPEFCSALCDDTSYCVSHSTPSKPLRPYRPPLQNRIGS